jgi:hypothetical protein
VLYRTTLWQPGTAYLPALGKSPVRQAWVGDLLPTTADANTAPQSGLRLVVAHLHSGSTNADEATRFAQIDTLLTWLNTQPLPERPTLWAGSLYFRRSSEAGLQQLLDAGLADPTGLTGTWNQRASFAAYHTQSTRLVGESDGGAGGGADSRDDFLLPHARLLATGGDIALQAETYATFGQDGSFFGESILEAKTLSPALREALYFASDHLPVYIDAQVPTQRTPPPTVGSFRVYPNPASQWLEVQPTVAAQPGATLRLLSATGQVVRTWPVGNGIAPMRLSLQGIAPGAYLLQLAHPSLPTQHQRVVVVGE